VFFGHATDIGMSKIKVLFFLNKSRLAHGIKGLIIHITKDDVEYRFSSERKER
jgi:hypothetical protein